MAKMNEAEMFNKSNLCMGRFAVPGGWLYFSNLNGAASPAFVPDPYAEHVVMSVKPTIEALRNEYNRGFSDAFNQAIEYLKNDSLKGSMIADEMIQCLAAKGKL